MAIKAENLDTIVNKLGFQTHESGYILAWFEHEGQIVARTKRSRKKGKDLPLQHQIRQQMKLDQNQMREAIRCDFTRGDYTKLLIRDKGLI